MIMRNFVLRIFSVLFLSFIVAGAQKPIPGTYFIVNRVLDPNGLNLTLTFQGENNQATMTPLSGSEPQRWIISDLYTNGTHSVTPVLAPDLEAAGRNNIVIALPQDGHVWTIRNTTGGYYTIQDPVGHWFWDLDSAVDGSSIAIKAGKSRKTQDWVLDLIEF